MEKGNQVRTRLLWLLLLLALVFCWSALSGSATQSKGDSKDGEAIQKQGEAFVEAFHKGDAKAVAAFWTPDGDYTDVTGRQLKGREAIEKAFKELFDQNKGLKIRIDSESLRFVTPDVAIEEGTSDVYPSDGAPPSRARYSIVHAKKDGQWLLASVREAPIPQAANEHLQSLEGIIGDWSGETERGEAERITITWDENQNFIVASFLTTLKGAPIAGAKQWIGWDPIVKNVRSWIFDSIGGFGEGAWTNEGGRWVVKTNSVLPEGKKASATYVIRAVDPETMTCRMTNRVVDRKSLPDTKEVRMRRIK
jgi:uncharacterized protein (TIGR02246 family)